ncbi:helix-turn-helix domain-containing protein [Chitinophaga defluvii]|uniref:AraC family transcriptional regulator n=1 Tax=Chitinophaga defluvii TaxID=3163343 RepID=A0ABV2T1R8_9BACT
MKFIAGFLNVVLLLGTIQGFIISGLLFYAKKRSLSKRLLAGIIFFLTLACMNLYLGNTNWFQINRWVNLIFSVIPLVIIMPIGPLIYFYVKSCTDPAFSLQRKDRIHFYPVIIDLGAQLAAAIFIVGVLTGLLPNKPQPWGLFIDTYNVYSDIPRWVSVTTYVWLSARYLTRLKASNEAPVEAPYYTWPWQMLKGLTIFQAIWLIYLIPYIIPRYSNALLDLVDWYPIYIPMVVLIYWLGMKGYLMIPQMELMSLLRQEVKAQKAAPAPMALPEDTIAETVPVLIKAMEEDRLYLDPNLNLALLVQHTGIPQKTISAVLNQHLNKSFNEFVNAYRIGYFKQKICDPRQEHLTILGVAYDSGFNSQATFQRAFKNEMGVSPREYLAMELKKRIKSG